MLPDLGVPYTRRPHWGVGMSNWKRRALKCLGLAALVYVMSLPELGPKAAVGALLLLATSGILTVAVCDALDLEP
jgi:hypothetical protein